MLFPSSVLTHPEESRALIQAYTDDACGHPLLDAETERALARRMRDGDRAARDELVRCNQRLVLRMATAFRGRGVPLLDLVQEGNLGLLRGLDRYDPERGHKLSTYVIWWIRQSIQRGIHQQGRTIRLPTGMHETLHQLHGREPEDVGLTPREAHSVRQARETASVVSLDVMPQHDEDARAWYLPDGAAEDSATLAERHVVQQRVRAALRHLPARTAYVLARRYGLDGPPGTLEDVGREIGRTRERVRTLQVEGEARLREVLGAWRAEWEAS